MAFLVPMLQGMCAAEEVNRHLSGLEEMKKTVRGFFHIMALSFTPSPFVFSPRRTASCLRAAALLVQLDFVLEAVVQFKVVVLQRGGGA